jgi:hypothetical protein
MSTVVDLAAARLEVSVPARTVYKHAVPKGTPEVPLADKYLWVYSNAPVFESVDLADSQTLRQVTLWVTSAARAGDMQSAAEAAVWGAEKAQEALRGWRPAAGHWKPVPLSSQPVQRDDDLPDVAVAFVTSTWGFQYQS